MPGEVLKSFPILFLILRVQVKSDHSLFVPQTVTSKEIFCFHILWVCVAFLFNCNLVDQRTQRRSLLPLRNLSI